MAIKFFPEVPIVFANSVWEHIQDGKCRTDFSTGGCSLCLQFFEDENSLAQHKSECHLVSHAFENLTIYGIQHEKKYTLFENCVASMRLFECFVSYKKYKTQNCIVTHMKKLYHSVRQHRCGVCRKHCKNTFKMENAEPTSLQEAIVFVFSSLRMKIV
ncbi:hypothetical protein Rs2_07317 [Raphanus sativus]|nr:hypothetical protein Rs2_07317 [Raphanus sativus]